MLDYSCTYHKPWNSATQKPTERYLGVPFAYGSSQKKLDAGWPESEEEQVGNVKLEEEVRRRSKGDNQVKTNGSIDNKTDRYT